MERDSPENFHRLSVALCTYLQRVSCNALENKAEIILSFNYWKSIICGAYTIAVTYCCRFVTAFGLSLWALSVDSCFTSHGVCFLS